IIRESCGCLNQFMRRTFIELSGKGDSERKNPSVTKNIETVLEKIADRKATMSDLSNEIGINMRRLSEMGADPMEMAELISAIPTNPSLPDGKEIIQAAQALVGDIAQRLQLLKFIHAQQRQETLDTINRDSFQTYNLDLVLDSVEAELPVIGAKGCAIVLFSDPMDPIGKSRVIFSSSRGKRNAEARPDAPEFPTRRILPDGLWPDPNDPVSVYIEPLFFAERRLGYMVMERGDSDGASYASLASRLASVLEGAYLVRSLNEKRIELEKAYANILNLSERDSLTGLYNRRAFDREFLKEKRRMERYSAAELTICSLLFIDIDDFKRYNDAFGHAVGDAVLQAVAEAIAAIIRTTDIASRFGGDEFNVLLPATGVDGAENLASRILSRLKDSHDLLRRTRELTGNEYTIPDETAISCSIGISSSVFVGNDPEAMIKSADQALYEAKQAGKGCYRISKGIESG
ncbi:MAG: GGDEF domain-containing protein, partial [Anaerolineales bacterium]